MAFDLCIVGAGMIGSSAARHLLDWPNGAKGIKFYHEVGCLTVGDESSEFLDRSNDSAKQQKLPVECLTGTETEVRFPYLSLCNSRARAIYEARNAGYINPRLMVAAQQKLAQTGGCRIIREIVNSVETVNPVLSKITTDEGTEVLAKKVLVATGAFTDFRSILPRHLQLRLQPVTQSVIFAELSEEDQRKMKNMPSMLIKYDYQESKSCPKSDTEGRTKDYDCYILPPIKYPDGKVYLKLGHGHSLERPLNSPKEIANWYLSSVPNDWENKLKELLKSRFTDIKPVSFHYDTCATVDTPTGRPYIDLVGTNMGVVLGDNGLSAKSCDEIGRLAASLIVKGRWEDDLPREAFKMIVKSKADSKL